MFFSLQLDEMQEKFRNLQENLEKAQDIIDEVSLKDVEVMTICVEYFLAVYCLVFIFLGLFQTSNFS